MLTVLALLAAAASNPGLTKPSPPTMPVLATADCENAQIRSIRIAALDDDQSWTGSADRYNADWKSYLDVRLGKLGMSERDKQAFMAKVANSDEFGALQTENEKILAEMSANFEKIGDSASEEQACKTVAGMLAALTPIMVNASKQYELIDNAIIAEAKRRGVSLDD